MLSRASPPEAGSVFSALRLADRRCVVVAVSGGGDSLALLLLLQQHLANLRDGPSLLAVTVDHGLRPASAEEARSVGGLCAERGIAHCILRWEGPKPATGLAAAAREARLRLLGQAAAEAGSDLVVTGHTADDQAETLAMRLARGGGRGGAGIAPATLYDERIWFVRPLIETRRRALRAFLEGLGVGWIEDPTNRDPRFERARVRASLAEDEIGRLTGMAREAARVRTVAGQAAADLVAAAARRVAPGLIRLARPAMAQAGQDAALYALRILLAVAGGMRHLPDEARSAALLAGAGREGQRASLSRCVVAGRKEHLYLRREHRNLPRTPLAGGLVWDGRYRVFGEVPAADLDVAAYGEENAREAEAGGGADAPASLVRAALAAEPALWAGERCLGLATGRVQLRPVAAPWVELLPSFDLAPAAAAARLIGGRPPPPSPWYRHKDGDR